MNHFSLLESFGSQVSLTLVENANSFSSMNDIYDFLSFVHASHPDAAGNLFVADQNTIAKYKEQHVIQQEISNALADDRVEVLF